MKDKFESSYSPEVQEKVKKNLVWIIVFSITMLFAGFTSGYIVSMGDSFWVKVNLPTAFHISTAVIIISSITLILAIKAAKQKNHGKVKALMTTTLVLGLAFAFLQFQGYKQLVDKGAMFNTWIIVSDGRYGDYFEVKKEDAFLEVNNNQYAWKGESLDKASLEHLQNFMQQFMQKEKDDLSGIQYGETYVLYYKGEPLSLTGGKLLRPNGEGLQLLDYDRLRYLARNILDNRADFFMSGEMGKDFTLYYKGKPLDYIDRKLQFEGKELSTNLQNKLLRGNKDTSTAYLYIITFLHLLHVVGGLIMLTSFVKSSFKEDYVENNALSMRAGSIFWHFLGGLWIYLLLFLTFIH